MVMCKWHKNKNYTNPHNLSTKFKWGVQASTRNYVNYLWSIDYGSTRVRLLQSHSHEHQLTYFGESKLYIDTLHHDSHVLLNPYNPKSHNTKPPNNGDDSWILKFQNSTLHMVSFRKFYKSNPYSPNYNPMKTQIVETTTSHTRQLFCQSSSSQNP